ncbi:hypothetical protein V202x_39720 [Gimesia aquarii]|uniref:Uncharacterized protein n=1 Tax=Gimesia aquarii TaxID=2527964 RepID=A0A517WZ86_9PLAN|nr:hypothetical protein V202x_39720 [Gimesia aquarii]
MGWEIKAFQFDLGWFMKAGEYYLLLVNLTMSTS